MTFTAQFYRYHQIRTVDDFERPSDALSFLIYGEDEGSLSSVAVLDGDGNVLADKEAISNAYIHDTWRDMGDRLDAQALSPA